MRAELYRPEEHHAVVAVATWSPDAIRLDVRDEGVKGLDALLRMTPVVVDDPSLRRLGTRGEVQLQPGSLEWFRAALLTRAPDLGLAVRFVAEDVRDGWDPAPNYRTFAEQAARLAASD